MRSASAKILCKDHSLMIEARGEVMLQLFNRRELNSSNNSYKEKVLFGFSDLYKGDSLSYIQVLSSCVSNKHNIFEQRL